jgi:Tfp pilus assembly pilus retraction ATPase PilT
VLIATDAVKNIIRHRDSFMLRNVITTGVRYGMITMRQSIGDLIDQGLVDRDAAEGIMANY